MRKISEGEYIGEKHRGSLYIFVRPDIFSESNTAKPNLRFENPLF
jgi:hypothetical protein